MFRESLSKVKEYTIKGAIGFSLGSVMNSLVAEHKTPVLEST